jgi:hypothetical protein
LTRVVVWVGSEFAPPAPGHDPLETMTNEDYSKVPPPHLLKKFSEQAREDSQKRGHPGYCKTFAKLCIDWAFREAAMDDLRAASAEVSEAASQPGSSSGIEHRSDIVVPPELIEQWRNKWIYKVPHGVDELDFLAQRGAQWGADQELEACCEWLKAKHWIEPEFADELRAARRPKPATLKEQSLKHLDVMERDGYYLPEILEDLRRAVEQLDD